MSLPPSMPAGSRMTRARAAQVAEQLHVDEDAILALTTDASSTASELKAAAAEREHGQHEGQQHQPRKPLGELTTNSAETSVSEETCGAEEEAKVATRQQGVGRGAKGGKQDAAAETKSEVELEAVAGLTTTPAKRQTHHTADGSQASSLPASVAAAERPSKDPEHLASFRPTMNTATATPMRASMRANADTVGDLEREQTPLSLASGRATRGDLPNIEIPSEQQEQGEAMRLSTADRTEAEPTSPAPTAMPNVIANLRTETPAKRSTSNKENIEPTLSAPTGTPGMATPARLGPRPGYDALEAAAVGSATPPATDSRPQSSARSPVQDAISALDDLDDAVEKVRDQIPDVPASPEKQRGAVGKEEKPVTEERQATAEKPATQEKSAAKVKKAPIVRTTKAAQARISLAHGSKEAPRPPAWGRPRESSGLSASISSRRSSVLGQRILSSGSNASSLTEEAEKKDITIPHSKPRPMSMSFPAPPPPPRSSKAPTKATFQLPGEAVAAKLKAAREERAKKEEEDKKVFKARPVPAALKRAPSVKQTTASRARESLGLGKSVGPSAGPAQHRRASSVATSRPAGARQSMASSKPPAVNGARLAPAAQARLHGAKRSSTSMANIGKPRVDAAGRPNNAMTTSPPTGKGTTKGKEVFARAANAKDAAAREKRDKEEAARKARAEAAERSRLLSREWAERKKRGTMGLKPEAAAAAARNGHEDAVAADKA